MRTKRAVILVALVALLLPGCNQSSPNRVEPEQNLILEISKPDKDGTSYIKYRTIKNARMATEIKLILKQADESNSLASMSRSPDRKISLINTSPAASAEPRVYGIWHSPNPKFIEVVSESTGGGYIQLNREDSVKVMAVLK